MELSRNTSCDVIDTSGIEGELKRLAQVVVINDS